MKWFKTEQKYDGERFCKVFHNPHLVKDIGGIDEEINLFLSQHPEYKVVSMAAAIGSIGSVICYFEKIKS